MAILIKNPDAERRARELAALTGETLTAAVDGAVKLRLAHERAQARKRPTAEQMLAATGAFRRQAGLEQRSVAASKATFDALWDEEDRRS